MPIRHHPDVRVLSSRTVHPGRIFDVIREELVLPSGLRQDIEIVDHPGAVAVAALDENGDLLLVRQYRHACGDWMLEIPAGRIERGEDRLTAAMRELEEETRHRASSWELLSEFYAAPGFCSELLSVFLARGLVHVGDDARAADEDEEFVLERMSAPRILEAGLQDAKTIIAASLVVARGLAPR
ncbi:MAG: NUDIX hydrolase [Planctomycetota bacterium]|nr:NUDIX hydrolase [Planctomycetota bacterium]